MNSTAMPPTVRACDPIAAAVEEHLLKMQSGGYGELAVERKQGAVLVGFGGVWARGEDYDIALVRLAGALLNDARLCDVFLRRIRGSMPTRR